jgi:hypothetical protein
LRILPCPPAQAHATLRQGADRRTSNQGIFDGADATEREVIRRLVNLVEQLSAHALSAWDTENHFRAMAATGDVHKALAVLDRLDQADTAP